MVSLSYQGISDSIATSYMEQDGRVRWQDIVDALAHPMSCAKLTCYWTFEGCGYRKGSGICANPEHQRDCPLPQHDLRNAGLNRTAYILFFLLDVAEGDFVGWFDQQLAAVAAAPIFDRHKRLRHALLLPLGHVHGASNKVLAMALSDLLIAADAKRAEHLYGPRCYAENGCAAIIERIAARIDARHSNPAYPVYFPRFVQHAVWRFCAEAGLNRCNGRRIDDRAACAQNDCVLYPRCARVPLRPLPLQRKARGLDDASHDEVGSELQPPFVRIASVATRRR